MDENRRIGRVQKLRPPSFVLVGHLRYVRRVDSGFGVVTGEMVAQMVVLCAHPLELVGWCGQCLLTHSYAIVRDSMTIPRPCSTEKPIVSSIGRRIS